ncbi:hypothetical protein [Mycobacteroides abscessus]
MGSKLEPTAAQRKAMHDALDEAIDKLFTLVGIGDAANSVPEGAPVGTIARRPDGKWIAVRTTGNAASNWWTYSYTGVLPVETLRVPDADSWPVIYDPDEYHEGDKPRLERLMREPSVFDADPHGTVNLDGTLPTFTPDPTAQQEPAYTVAAASEEMAKYWDNSIVTTTKREPRVVDRLGVDEQGSRWHGAEGAAAYFHDGQSWRTNQGRVFAAGYQPDWNAPYTEILEPQPEAEGESSPKSSPRVLPSLDCEEARDGTVWEEPDGWRFWFNGEWRTDNGTRGRDLNLYQPSLLRLSTRSYTEVLPDVG